MAAWQPYWIVRYLYSKFSSALNNKAKIQCHITWIYGYIPCDFEQCSIAIHPLPIATLSYGAGVS